MFKNSIGIEKSTRSLISGFKAGVFVAAVAAIALSAKAGSGTVKDLMGIKIDIARWLPGISAKLQTEVQANGKISGVQISSIFGTLSYSVGEMRGGSISPDFHGERLLSFGLDSKLNDYTGGLIHLTFAVAPSAGGGCRALKVEARKYAEGKRVYAMSPVSGQPISAISIRAYENNGRREIDKVVLEDSNGRQDVLNLAGLPMGRCP